MSVPAPPRSAAEPDGILEDGTRVFCGGSRSPYGMMAERTVVSRAWCLPVPEEIDDVTAAALPNPALSAWLALAWRAQLRAGETVLILGGDRGCGPTRCPDCKTPWRRTGGGRRTQSSRPRDTAGSGRRRDLAARSVGSGADGWLRPRGGFEALRHRPRLCAGSPDGGSAGGSHSP